ncbi:substrate-binding domain-containing protein [Bacillus sp. V3B]|uniref:sugar ABC transporter substrate-binding protein n=1 Tax=Bacillus sp. V3B TaxID=2804915 RepID=UPI00210E5CA3|nr:substrate-binding domain-containing protein [Bacillus sp. V3B]MCQ6276905.1 substrate-binding domain-containing protein [Bacillus sp. V3B]
MLKKRKWLLLITFMISVILIVTVFKQFEEEKPKVVIVLKNFDFHYWDFVKAGAEKGFKDFGVDGRVIAPKGGTREEQKNMVKDILKEKPDVLIISPIYAPTLIPELETFVENDIPVLLIHSDDSWENKTAYIGTNNLELGRRAGILMASQLQPGDKVALLGGEQVAVEGERTKGIKASLEAVGIKITVQKEGLPPNHPEVVENRMEVILQNNPDLKGVITTSEYLAIPALKVIQEQGLDIPVTGADGSIEMLKVIQEGTLPSAVTQNPYDMGYLSVETATKVTKGEKANPIIDSGVDIITKENAKQRLEFYNKLLK